ncbi:response regulator [Chloroflexota bacterium]
MNTGDIAIASIIRVVLVDGHELARQGIHKLLDSDISIKIVGEAAAYHEAISLISKLDPDVVLLDIRLEESSGIDVAKFIKANIPATKILVLTAHNDHQYVKAMARTGVNGYLIKTVSAEQLQRSIRNVAEGGLVFPDNTTNKVTSTLQNDEGKNGISLKKASNGSCKHADMLLHSKGLTSKEAEVFEHVACGLRNYEVANHMDISIKTVEAHVRHILRKLGARNRTQAVSKAKITKWQ